MINFKPLSLWLKEVTLETITISRDLFKLMIPILLIVKLIELMGGTDFLAQLIEPLMASLGLPPEMGVVWAAAMLSNIYTGMVLFISEPLSATLSGSQVTVMGILMLFAHSLPVELRVAQKIGVSLWVSFVLRTGTAYLGAWIYYQLSQLLGASYVRPQMRWEAVVEQHDLSGWLISNLVLLGQIVLIIALLVVLLRVIRLFRLDRLIHFLLAPVLPLLGLTNKAVNIVLVGITLGLTYGGGLLIQESKQGVLDVRELFFSVCLLLICHGLIEDTLLILLLGADLYGILLLRVLLSLLLIALLVSSLRGRSEAFFTRLLMNRHYQGAKSEPNLNSEP